MELQNGRRFRIARLEERIAPTCALPCFPNPCHTGAAVGVNAHVGLGGSLVDVKANVLGVKASVWLGLNLGRC